MNRWVSNNKLTPFPIIMLIHCRKFFFRCPFSLLIEMSSTDEPNFPSLPQELIQDGQPQA